MGLVLVTTSSTLSMPNGLQLLVDFDFLCGRLVSTTQSCSSHCLAFCAGSTVLSIWPKLSQPSESKWPDGNEAHNCLRAFPSLHDLMFLKIFFLFPLSWRKVSWRKVETISNRPTCCLSKSHCVIINHYMILVYIICMRWNYMPSLLFLTHSLSQHF